MAPHIRAEEHVQTAQTQMIRVCAIFIPPIFICYIVHLHHHTGPTHQDGSACINRADPDLNRVCTICHTTHIHVITSPQWLYILRQKWYALPEWSIYWDRFVVVVVVLLFYVSWTGLDRLWQLPLLNQRKEKRKYMARPRIESRTSDLQVRCPTDCATRPGYWDRSVCTNSADPDLTRVRIFWHTASIYMLY